VRSGRSNECGGLRYQAQSLGRAAQRDFGSDIGHWDVPDVRDVTREAYELVERGLIRIFDLPFVSPGKRFNRDIGYRFEPGV
jgi:hypothetical protein